MARRPPDRLVKHLQNKTSQPPATKLPGGHIVHEVRGEMSWSSHLPPPNIVEAYNQIIPSFGEDLHRGVMNEMKHRRSCDSWLVKGGTLLGFNGQLCALIIVLAVLYVALEFGRLGYPGTAAIIVGIDLLGIVGAFLGRSYVTQKANTTDTKREATPAPE